MINRISTYTPTMMVSTNPPIVEIEDENTFEETLADVVSTQSTGDCPEDLESIFETASETYHISLDLLKAVAKAESDFNPNCTSSSGAMGIMQLMPGTAKELGVTNAYDPEQNIMAGAKYLSENLDIFKDNISLAVAAYNAGRGAVKKYAGIPPYSETQSYVKKVLSYMNEDIEIPSSAVTTSQVTDQKDNDSDEAFYNHKLSKKEKSTIEQLSASANTIILSKLYS